MVAGCIRNSNTPSIAIKMDASVSTTLNLVYNYLNIPSSIVSMIDVYVGVHKNAYETFKKYVLPDLVRCRNCDTDIVIYSADHLSGNRYDESNRFEIMNITYEYIKTTDYERVTPPRFGSPKRGEPGFEMFGRTRYSHMHLKHMTLDEMQLWEDCEHFSVHETSEENLEILQEQDWYLGDNINNKEWCFTECPRITNKLTFVYELRYWLNDNRALDDEYEYEDEYETFPEEEIPDLTDRGYYTIFAINPTPPNSSRDFYKYEAIV